MRQMRLGFAGQEELRWEDLPAKTRQRLMELLCKLIEAARWKKEDSNDER